MLTLLAPSRRVLLVFGFVPFTNVRSDRPGVSVWSFWNDRRRRAGHQVDQRLVVPVLVERKIDDLLRLQLRVQVGLVGLQQLRAGGHRHRLGQRADLELHVDAADLARGHRHAGLDELHGNPATTS